MSRIQAIDQRILQLQQEKENAEKKEARALYKRIEGILGKGFDIQLAAQIITQSWTQAAEQQKEEWRQQAATFSKPSRSSAYSQNCHAVASVAP